MNRIFTITTLLLLTFQVFGQDYKHVNIEMLNIGKGAGKDYNVIGQVNKGDRVTALSESGSWTQIETDSGLKGYVASKYLVNTIGENKTESKNKKVEAIGFKYGFYKAFQNFFLIVLLIFAGIEYYKSKRIKDGRYSKGYKKIPFTT